MQDKRVEDVETGGDVAEEGRSGFTTMNEGAAKLKSGKIVLQCRVRCKRHS